MRYVTTNLLINLLCFSLNGSLYAQEINLNTRDKQTTDIRPLPEKATFGKLVFLGEAIIETGYMFEGVPLGGLSGITYDAINDIYYCISDDYSNIAPARFYTLKIDVSDGTLNEGDVKVTAMTTLLDKNGRSFARGSIDPEGIVLTKAGTLYISSEGDAKAQIDPFICELNLDGSYLHSLVIPQKYLPTPGGKFGVRDNRAFESLTSTQDQRFLFTATENALVQDGPQSELNTVSPARILKYDLAKNNPVAEFLYWVEPVVAAPAPANAFRINGLVELVAVNENTLVAMERSFSVGVGNAIKLYQIALAEADDISGYESLKDVDLNKIKAVKKTLLFDLAALGIRLDNIEGMTFGPRLKDGRQTLILVSDNNFNPSQFTQFLAFAFHFNESNMGQQSTTPIHQIQGSSHISPFAGKFVENVSGIVISDPTIKVLSSGNALLDPTVIGVGGRMPPTKIIGAINGQ